MHFSKQKTICNVRLSEIILLKLSNIPVQKAELILSLFKNNSKFRSSISRIK